MVPSVCIGLIDDFGLLALFFDIRQKRQLCAQTVSKKHCLLIKPAYLCIVEKT